MGASVFWPRYAGSVACLGVLALLASVAAWHGVAIQRWEEPLLFVALATAALVFPVPVAPGRAYMLMPAVAAAAVLIFAPPLALLVVGVGSLAGNLVLVSNDQRERWAAVLDIGQTLLGMAFAAAILDLTLPRVPAVAALLLAAAALYLAETFTAAGAVTLRRGGTVLRHWWSGCQEGFLPVFALYLVGLVIGLAADHHPRAAGLTIIALTTHPWVGVVVAIPVVLLYLSLHRTVALAAALRSANEALEALIQAAPLAIVVHDRAGRVTIWNPAASRLLGWSKEEVLGQPSPAIPETMRRQFFAQLDATLRGRAHQPTEAWWRRKDGDALAVALWMAPLRGAGGKRTGAMTIVTDITEQREAEARQRFVARASKLLGSSLEYEATLEHVLALAVPGLADWCAVDGIGRHGGAERLACRPDDPGAAPPTGDLASLVLKTIQSGQMQPALAAPEAAHQPPWHDSGRDWCAAAAPGLLCLPLRVRGQTVGALTLAANDGQERFAGAGAALAEELAGRAALAIEHARLYKEAQEATSRAEAAVRARDEFLSIAAHELKTPLAAMQGFSELAAEQLAAPAPDPARVGRSVAAVRRQANRLSRLVQQLLDVTRLETGRLKLDRRPTDLVPLVAEAVEAAPAQTGSHRWSLQAPPALWATVDSLRCEQVLTNLLSNAGKYSPEGTAIDVRVAQPSPDNVQVSVRDHGNGVPAEHRVHLFERFYRVQPDGSIPGMGLGLYVSRQIAEAHGGTLIAEFPPDGGSCFTLTLPAQPEQPAAPSPPAVRPR